MGQTHQKCANRMNSHKYDIAHFPDTLTNVSEHFNSPGHSVQDFFPLCLLTKFQPTGKGF